MASNIVCESSGQCLRCCDTNVPMCCGVNPLSMSTVNPNPSACQSVCGNCGGASSLSQWLNAVGKWGTVLTATAQGKPVAATKTGVAVGAKGATSLTGGFSPNAMILVLVIVIGLIVLATRK